MQRRAAGAGRGGRRRSAGAVRPRSQFFWPLRVGLERDHRLDQRDLLRARTRRDSSGSSASSSSSRLAVTRSFACPTARCSARRRSARRAAYSESAMRAPPRTARSRPVAALTASLTGPISVLTSTVETATARPTATIARTATRPSRTLVQVRMRRILRAANAPGAAHAVPEAGSVGLPAGSLRPRTGSVAPAGRFVGFPPAPPGSPTMAPAASARDTRAIIRAATRAPATSGRHQRGDDGEPFPDSLHARSAASRGSASASSARLLLVPATGQAIARALIARQVGRLCRAGRSRGTTQHAACCSASRVVAVIVAGNRAPARTGPRIADAARSPR